MIAKPYEEILEEMLDEFTRTTKGEFEIDRNDANVLYAFTKAVAKGYEGVQNSYVATQNRFNPQSCDITALNSLSKIAGTLRWGGSGSGLAVTALNTSDTEQVKLTKGTYKFESPIAEIFYFDLEEGVVIPPKSSKTFPFISENEGKYRVLASTGIQITASAIIGGETVPIPIDSKITFSCLDNVDLQGYEEESIQSFRDRLSKQRGRQDSLFETEMAIKSRKYVFDASVLYNAGGEMIIPYGKESITVPPFHMAIALSGVPRAELGEYIAAFNFRPTTMVDENKYILYKSPCLKDGQIKFYYMDFAKKPFDVSVLINYNEENVSLETVEHDINVALESLKNAVVHRDYVTERDVYELLREVKTETLAVLNVELHDHEILDSVPYISASRLEIPYLANVKITKSDKGVM